MRAVDHFAVLRGSNSAARYAIPQGTTYPKFQLEAA